MIQSSLTLHIRNSYLISIFVNFPIFHSNNFSLQHETLSSPPHTTMRRSARVQALETIKRRKLGRSHVTETSNTTDHVTQKVRKTEDGADDKTTTVVGQSEEHVTGDTNVTAKSELTKHSHVTNGNHVTNTPTTPSTTLYRTTRSQAKRLSQTLISPPNSLTNQHVTSPLDQFRFVKTEPAEPTIKTESAVKTEPAESAFDESAVKPEPSDYSAYFKEPPITDIEDVAQFAPPDDFDIASNPSVLSQPGPRDWGSIYSRVKKMRAEILAPVDTMGCERLVQNGVPAKVQRYQLLISLMLSSQTKDEVTCQAVLNLREFLKSRHQLLSVEGVTSMTEAEIDACICKVGFHNKKAVYIKRATSLLVEKFNSDVPPTINEMVSLPGVGPKMAHLLMHRAWGVNEGIGVDVHVHRLANMWKWVKSKTPEETRMQLEKWLPKELWIDINPTLVGFGQTVCPSKGKKCGVCVVSRELCKSREKGQWREEKWMKEGYRGVVVEYEEGEKK